MSVGKAHCRREQKGAFTSRTYVVQPFSGDQVGLLSEICSAVGGIAQPTQGSPNQRVVLAKHLLEPRLLVPLTRDSRRGLRHGGKGMGVLSHWTNNAAGGGFDHDNQRAPVPKRPTPRSIRRPRVPSR